MHEQLYTNILLILVFDVYVKRVVICKENHTCIQLKHIQNEIHISIIMISHIGKKLSLNTKKICFHIFVIAMRC